jgi:hypothetical protein
LKKNGTENISRKMLRHRKIKKKFELLKNKRKVDWVRQLGFAQRRVQVKIDAKMSRKKGKYF